MKKSMKKTLSMILVLSMLIGLCPAVTLPVQAASNIAGTFEGQDSDVFTALGFDTLDLPEGYDAETTENPTGREISLGSQVFEMVIASKSGMASYGYNNNNQIAAEIDGDVLGNGLPFVMSAAAAGDFNGDGLPGELVYVGIEAVNGGSSGKSLKMLIYDGNGTAMTPGTVKTVGTGITPYYTAASTETREELTWYDWAWQNLLQVSAGDYDGDGISEIAVYVADYAGGARVDIYKYQKTSQSGEKDWLKGENWARVWSHALSGAGEPLPNMVSLTSGDISRDGVDDLAIASGRFVFSPYSKDVKAEVDASSAIVLWGSKTNMLQSRSAVDLNTDELGEQARVSLITGDLDGDGVRELIATGQSAVELRKYNGTTDQETEAGNRTRTMTTYLYDLETGLGVNTSKTQSPIDGEVIVTDYPQTEVEEGGTSTTEKTSKKWGGQFDNIYFSTPLMKTNAAVIFPEGSDYSYLYLDSYLYESVEGQLNLKSALDEELYDGEHSLGGDITYRWGHVMDDDSKNKTTASDKQLSMPLADRLYVEFGAVSEDINGEGRSVLVTGTYAQNSRRDGDERHSAGYSVLYGQENGILASQVHLTENAKSSSAVDSDFITYTPVYADIDIDTTIIEYTGEHYLSYSDPKVLAIIAAAPYFEDVDVISDYDYAWQNTTGYSTISGSGKGDHVALDLEIGNWVSASSTIAGGNFNVETSALLTLEWQKETTRTTEYTLTFETSQDEDAVAFFSVPIEHYVYNVKTADGNGGYHTAVDIVTRTFTPCYQVLNLDYYESIRGNYDDLPAIRGEAITSTPGDPSSYPSSTGGYDVIAQWKDHPAGVSFGNGAITQEITVTKEEATSFNLGAALDFKAGGGADFQSDILQSEVEWMAGVQFSLNPSGGKTKIDLEGTSFSGTVTNMPLDFQDFGYYYTWRLFAYNYKLGKDNSIPVVSYVVGDISEPPHIPDDFKQDFDRSTSESNLLTWTYDGAFSSFHIYKYFDFPQGGGLQLVETIPASTNDYTWETDEDGKRYKQYFYEDVNLAAYTDYEYAIQVERLSAIPPLSAPSNIITARTKAADGYPTINFIESDGKQDGKQLIYPDKIANLTVDVSGPQGEDRHSYYSVVQYQWQKLEKGQWTELVNEKDMTLVFADAGVEAAGDYRCKINVLTKADNTGISTFTDPVTVTHAKRSGIIENLQVQDLSGGTLNISASVVNAHSDSGSVPGGIVTFTLTNNATGQTYQCAAELDPNGYASINMAANLPAGMYTVTAYYSGSFIFKAGTAEGLYLAQAAGGFDVDAQASLRYGEGCAVSFRQVTKSKDGLTLIDPAAPLSTGVYPAAKLGTKSLSGAVERKVGDSLSGGRNYRISQADGSVAYFTAPVSGTLMVVADGYALVTPVEGALTPGADVGSFHLSPTLDAGTYAIRMGGKLGEYGETRYAQTILVVERRSITLQLPTVQGQEKQAVTMPTLGELVIVSGSWADHHKDDTGFLDKRLNTASVIYTNTASSQYSPSQATNMCGYYVMSCTDPVNKNYAVRFLDGSLSVLGSPQQVTIAARYFEDQPVGTLYVLSPDQAQTRAALNDPAVLIQSQQTGTRMVFNAVPDEGYEVYDWYVNGVAQNSRDASLAHVVLNEDTAIEVQFAIQQNRLIYGTAGDAEGGTIVCTTKEDLISGSIVAPNAHFYFKAVAKPGYHFKEWRYNEAGAGTVYDDTDNGKMESRFELLMPGASCSVYAVFERDYYTFTYQDASGNDGLTAWYMGSPSGDATAGEEKITITSGDKVKGDTRITVEPKPGCSFDTERTYTAAPFGVVGSADYAAGTYTLSLKQDTSITGYTLRDSFNLDVEIEVAPAAGTRITEVDISVDYRWGGGPTTGSIVYDGGLEGAVNTDVEHFTEVTGGYPVELTVNHPSYYELVGWTSADTRTQGVRKVDKLAAPVAFGGPVQAGEHYYAEVQVSGETLPYYFIAPATGIVQWDDPTVSQVQAGTPIDLVVYASGGTFALDAMAKDETIRVHLKEKNVYSVTLADISAYDSTYVLSAPGGEFSLPEGAVCVPDADNPNKTHVYLHEGDDLTILVEVGGTVGSGTNTVTYWKTTTGGKTYQTKATSLKYTIPDIRAAYVFEPVFSSATYHTISWSTISEDQNGMTLSPRAGSIPSVATGGTFKFQLTLAEPSGDWDMVEGVYAGGVKLPLPLDGSTNVSCYEDGVTYTFEKFENYAALYTITGIRDNTEITMELRRIGITVDGVDVSKCSGNGWHYDPVDQTLTITGSNLTLSGTNTDAADSYTRGKWEEENQIELYDANDFHIVAESTVAGLNLQDLKLAAHNDSAHITLLLKAQSAQLNLTGESKIDLIRDDYDDGRAVPYTHTVNMVKANGDLFISGSGALTVQRSVSESLMNMAQAVFKVSGELQIIGSPSLSIRSMVHDWQRLNSDDYNDFTKQEGTANNALEFDFKMTIGQANAVGYPVVFLEARGESASAVQATGGTRRITTYGGSFKATTLGSGAPTLSIRQMDHYGGSVDLNSYFSELMLSTRGSVFPKDFASGSNRWRSYYEGGYLMGVNRWKLPDQSEKTDSMIPGSSYNDYNSENTGNPYDEVHERYGLGNGWFCQCVRLEPVSNSMNDLGEGKLKISFTDGQDKNNDKDYSHLWDYTTFPSGAEEEDTKYLVWENGKLVETLTDPDNEVAWCAREKDAEGTYRYTINLEENRYRTVTISGNAPDLDLNANASYTTDLILENITLRTLDMFQLGDKKVWVEGDNYVVNMIYDRQALGLNGRTSAEGHSSSDVNIYSASGTGRLTLIAFNHPALETTNLNVYNTEVVIYTINGGQTMISHKGEPAKINYRDGNVSVGTDLAYDVGWRVDTGTNAGDAWRVLSPDGLTDSYIRIYPLSRKMELKNSRPYFPSFYYNKDDAQHYVNGNQTTAMLYEEIDRGGLYSLATYTTGIFLVQPDGSERLLASGNQLVLDPDQVDSSNHTTIIELADEKILVDDEITGVTPMTALSPLSDYYGENVTTMEQLMQILPAGDYILRILFDYYDRSKSLDIPLRIESDAENLLLTPMTAQAHQGDTVNFTVKYQGVDVPAKYEWELSALQDGYGYGLEGLVDLKLSEGGTKAALTINRLSEPGASPTLKRITVKVDALDADGFLIGRNTAVITVARPDDFTLNIECTDELKSGDGSYTLHHNTDSTGRNWQFQARKSDGTVLTEGVTWSLWGNQRAATTVDSTGLLTVSSLETGMDGVLKLTAAYQDENGASYTGTIDLVLSTDARVQLAEETTGQEGISAVYGTDTTLSESGWVPADSAITVTAEPAAGYKVVGWTVNGVQVTENETYTMDGNTLRFTARASERYTVAALYEVLERVTVTFSVEEGEGSLTATVNGAEISSGDGVLPGSTVVFTAEPGKHYAVSGWTLNGEAVNHMAETYRLMADGASTVTVGFVQNLLDVEGRIFTDSSYGTPVADMGSLTASIHGESLTPENGDDGDDDVYEDTLIWRDVPEGSDVTLVASPKAGCMVAGWYRVEDGVNTLIPDSAGLSAYRVTDLDSSKASFSVQFVPLSQHSITIYTNSYEYGAGTVTVGETVIPASSSGKVNTQLHDTLVLIATPDGGSVLYQWKVEGTEDYTTAGNALILNDVEGDITVTAIFRRGYHKVSLISDDMGTIAGTYTLAVGESTDTGDLSGEDTLRSSSAIELTLTPDAGYYLEALTVNGEPVKAVWDAGSGTYRYTMECLAEDVEIAASFAPQPDAYPVTAPEGFAEEDTPTAEVAIDFVPDDLGSSTGEQEGDNSVSIAQGGSAVMTLKPAEGYEVDTQVLMDALDAILAEADSGAEYTISLKEDGYGVTITGVDTPLDFGAMASPVVPIDGDIPETYQVFLEVPENGSLQVFMGDIEVQSGASVPAGTEITMVAVPADGYELESLMNDGAVIPGDTLTVEAEVNLKATFVLGAYKLSIHITGSGTVLVNGTAYTEDTQIELDAGSAYTVAYRYDEQTTSVTGTEAGDYTMDGDATVTAIFTVHSPCANFTPWTAADALPTQKGDYHLAGNVTLTEPWTVTEEINLCLNGKTITGDVVVGEKGSLTMTDCQSTGKLSGTITVYSSGPVCLYGGDFAEAELVIGCEQFDVTKEAEIAIAAPVGYQWKNDTRLIEVTQRVAITDTGRTLSLNGEVYINQYVTIDGITDPSYGEENGGLLIWTAPVTEEDAVFGAQDDISEGLIYVAQSDEFAQQTRGIATKEYADELYLRVYVRLEDGSYAYGPLTVYSVQMYCESKLANSTNEKLKNTCAALLHFGAAAQVYFKYNLNDLANANILDTYPAAAWDPGLITPLAAPVTNLMGGGSVADKGKSISLEGELNINFYFAPENEGTTFEGGILRVWEGVTGELTEANVSYTVDLQAVGGSEWAAQSQGIAAKGYGDTIYAQAVLTDSVGKLHCSDVVAYSAEAYAAGRIEKSGNPDLVELVKRMVLYGEFAKNYFSR